jgi:hypothetical protein
MESVKRKVTSKKAKIENNFEFFFTFEKFLTWAGHPQELDHLKIFVFFN